MGEDQKAIDEIWLRSMIHRGQERCAGRDGDVGVDARDRTRGHNARGVVCERVHMDNNQDLRAGTGPARIRRSIRASIGDDQPNQPKPNQ